MERFCYEDNMTKEDRICMAFLQANNAAQAGSLEEMYRRNCGQTPYLCGQTSDDSVIIIEEPIETIEICSSSSSYENAEVIDRQVMTKAPRIQSSDPFKSALANAWCSDRSALCCDAYELFKMAYCRRHPHLQRNVDEKTTTLWHHMTAAQRIPFHAEAFVSQTVCKSQPFNENCIRDYFENVNGVVKSRK